jgi:ABC-2 type transport system permease protein
VKNIDANRIRAVIRKELRDYRRKRSIVLSMSALPITYFIIAMILILVLPVSKSGTGPIPEVPLLYLLLIPAMMPAIVASYSIVGEREQGTLEPLLATPILEQELILGKAAAVMLPTMVLSYGIYGLFLLFVRLFAKADVASAVFHDGPVLLALLLFAPLVAGWSISVGMAASVRATEARVAQQMATLSSVPVIGVIVLMMIGLVHPKFVVSLAFGVGLLVLDAAVIRLVVQMFNRERLITGNADTATGAPRPAGFDSLR